MKVFFAILNILIVPQVILGGLVEDLQRNGLTTLLDFVVKAGLADKLQEPLTLFAPTNEAFAKLPPEVVQALTENPQLLQNTLLYHVIPGAKIPSTALQPDNKVITAAGSPLRVNVYQKGHRGYGYKVVTANGKKVVKADVPAGEQSIVHVVDEVIPYLAADDNIPAVLAKSGKFNTLLAAVSAANLAGALSDENGSFTVFAPNDKAFDKVPKATLDFLLKPENVDQLAAVLTRHVLPKVVYSKAICWKSFATLNPNEMLKTQKYRGGVVVVKSSAGQARIVDVDMAATNGVVHEIDTVI